MDQTVAEEYKSSLSDLNFNSKPLINMLTMLADENKKHAATIVKTIVDHINSASAESMLPGLYLVDSIMKNIGEEYMKIFCLQIIDLFTSVFEKVDENTRSLMFKLRQTWTGILPNKILYNLDVSVKKLDPAWPITAKPPSKRILLNPKFFDGSAQQKKISQSPADSSTTLKKEDQTKQDQGEVIKQLLAKQEQLKQLALQKQQLSMKKNITVGPNVLTVGSFKKNPRDPRMVKINVSQNISLPKTNKISPIQGKTAAPKVEVCPTSSSIPNVKSVISTTKANVQTNSISNTNIVEQGIKPTDHHPAQQKKVSPKNKTEKHAINKSKEGPFPIHKSTEIKSNTENTPSTIKADKLFAKNDNFPIHKTSDEIKSSTENVTSTNKTDKPVVKHSNSSLKLHEKKFKECSKGSKIMPKKKISDSDKITQVGTNTSNDVNKKQVPQMKIPKKIEKQNSSLKSESQNNVDCKAVSKNEKEQICSFSDTVNSEIKSTSAKLSDIANKPKSIKTNDSQQSMSDLKTIANKDEDLRMKPLSSEETTTSARVPKRVITDSLPGEIDKLHPPRKKIKSDDAENDNPENRSEAPVLFGCEDQDLRHVPFSDINSKDWSQYKANHPDEYSPSPVRPENYDGRYRSRKYHFPNKYYHPFDYDRYGHARPSRGRYFSRRSRRYFHRGMRGGFFNSPIASVMLDSHEYLRQAEEKFRAGQISEKQYIGLRRDLQQMAESSEYELFKDYFPRRQEKRHARMPENMPKNREHDHEPERIDPDIIRLQRSSVNPPSEKTFFLDGKERVLHFIDDKAIVLMDNNEPHELSFKDEQKQIYVDGMAEPLTLGFDGKSIEFEVDGKRHSMKFGIPGRELYINNHPFEAQFGGPPLVAMLDDGRVYKMHLAGPAPQVVVGPKPEFELFSKHHDEASKSNVQKSLMECNVPSSSSLQDVDMRMKPNSAAQHDTLINEDSPFYCKDMKDVDWRQMPPSSNLKETEDKTSSMLSENVASNYATWINKDDSSFPATNEVLKSSLKEPVSYKWDVCEEQQPLPSLAQQQKLHPPEELLQQQHPPEDLNLQRQHPAKQLDLQRQHTAEHAQEFRQQPPECLEEHRQPPPEFIQDQRQHPPEYIQDHGQHPQDHIPKHRQILPEHIQEQRQYPSDHVSQQSQHLPEHVQHHQYPSIHMEQLQHPSEHIQQQQQSSSHMQHQQRHLAPHMQQEQSKQPQHSENQLNGSTQNWNSKQDNYWQNDSYRKSYQSPYLDENNAYQPTQTSNQRFEGECRFEPPPHPAYVPYGPRSYFQGRHLRGRYQGPRFRPPHFNSDFVRQRHNAPLLDQPRARYPGEAPRHLLPPPPLPPPSLSTSFTHITDVPVRASSEIPNKKIALLPTPGTSSAIPSTEPSAPKMQVDIESLLEKLVAAGIINTKLYEEAEPEPEPEPESTDTDIKIDTDKESEEAASEIEKIELTTESLRIHRPSVISALHKGMPCATCGMRFKELQNDHYSRHLDWHFRMNRREKDTKRVISRTWYYEIEDWIEFEEFEDFEERAPSYFELQAEDTQQEVIEVPAVISVPATNDDQESCPVCLEKFQLFWVEEEEEWHFRNAVRHDDVTYHPACYEDFKKTSEAEKALKALESTDKDSNEALEEVVDLLNTIIDDVIKIREIDANVPDQTDLPTVMEVLEVPHAEVRSEEVVLEGKPGEEEIIGLISESDIEMDVECSKAESEMVVMQSGGITLKVKAESLQSSPNDDVPEKLTKVENNKHLDDEEEIEFRPPTPDPNFATQPPVSKGRELSGLCCIM